MEESSGALSDAAIETLKSRGWCFGDLEQLKAMILIQSALADDARTVVRSVESELLNTDLKSVGAKSLPDPVTLRKSSHLLGPKVLQIAWVRDIASSNVDDFVRNSSRRLLKLGLSDGHGEVAAIEYSHIASFSDDVVPGTKVRLENKAVVRNGIVCLSPKVLTVLGGVVQSLYEEWEMNKKYSGFSRSTLRLSKESEGSGPPPFEKLQVGAPRAQLPRQDKPYQSGVNTKSSDATLRSSDMRPTEKQQQSVHSKSNDNPDKRSDMDVNPKMDSIDERTEEKPSSSAPRPKEAVEAVPVQNQAAAQKLLQKMSHQNQDSRYSRGRKFRGKGREEESEVFTLEEWEKRKAGAKPSIAAPSADVRRDEELAWQLQNQFDLEDFHVQTGPQNVGADDIRLSVFKYEMDDDWGSGMENERRGRGRGRGRGRRRGRGRGWEDEDLGYEMEHERSGRGSGWGRTREDDGANSMERGRGGSGSGWGRAREDDNRGYGTEHGRGGGGRGWGRARGDDGANNMERGRGSGWGRDREDDNRSYGTEHGRGKGGRGWGRRDDDAGGYGMEHGAHARGRGGGRGRRGR